MFSHEIIVYNWLKCNEDNMNDGMFGKEKAQRVCDNVEKKLRKGAEEEN